MNRLVAVIVWLVALSLGLAGCVFAVRSRTRTEIVAVLVHDQVQHIASHDGRIDLWLSRYQEGNAGVWRLITDMTTPVVYEAQRRFTDSSASAHVYKWRGVGVSWGNNSVASNNTYLSIEIPDWALWIPALWLGAEWFRRVLRRAAWCERGCCLTCGYDLRGSSGSGRCPECGATTTDLPIKPELTLS